MWEIDETFCGKRKKMSNAKRRAFERLRNYSSAETCREFERASRELIVYTTPRFQRTDLLLEELGKYLCVLFINQRGCMVNNPKVVPNDKKLSCKGTFTKTCSANIKGHRQWQHATLFILLVSGLSMEIPKRSSMVGIRSCYQGKSCIVCNEPLNGLDVPFKLRSGSTGDSKVASRCCRNSKE